MWNFIHTYKSNNRWVSRGKTKLLSIPTAFFILSMTETVTMLRKWRVWLHSLTSVVINFRMVIWNISIDHENVKTYIMESPEGDLLWVQKFMIYDNYITSALVCAVLKFVFVKLVSKEIVEVTTSDLMQIFLWCVNNREGHLFKLCESHHSLSIKCIMER